MRRVLGLTLIAMLALAVFVVPAAADVPSGLAGGEIVLAVEEGVPAGPEPMDRLDEDNPARELAGFENPDVPFTYGAAFLLAFAGLVGVSLLGLLYWLLVRRPARGAAESS